MTGKGGHDAEASGILRAAAAMIAAGTAEAAEGRARLQADRLERDGAADAALLWRRIAEEIRRRRQAGRQARRPDRTP